MAKKDMRRRSPKRHGDNRTPTVFIPAAVLLQQQQMVQIAVAGLRLIGERKK